MDGKRPRSAEHPGQSVYLVSDENEVLSVNKYEKLAIPVTKERIAVLLDLIIQDGARADRLFIPKAGKDRRADTFKVVLKPG